VSGLATVLGTLDSYPGDPDAAEVTLEELEVAVTELPVSVKEILRRGPIPGEGHGCRVCRAMQTYCYRGHASPGVELIGAFHGQRRVESGGDLDPDDAAACYLRCVLIYLIAGWDPESGWEAA
jgi:hypothetical protein